MNTNKLCFRSAEEVLKNRIPISDYRHFTSSSNPVSCFDPVRRKIFSPYHASFSGYGEQTAVFALSEIPFPGISGAKHYVLLESGVPFEGKTYRDPCDMFAIRRNECVRIFFLANSTAYHYFDWCPEEKRIKGGIRPVMCRPGKGPAVPLTSAVLEKYLEEQGCKEFRLTRDPREYLIMSSRPVWEGGRFYGTVTSGWSQPVLFRCSDGETIEFLSVIPAIAQYECALAVFKGKVYALLRGTLEKKNFFVADVNDWKFRCCGYLPAAGTRAQMGVFKDQMFIAYSENDIQPNKIRNGRNNMIILTGEGEDLNRYQEVFRIVDEYGFVSFDLVDCGETLFVIWSNSERFPDKPVPISGVTELQGKDILFCSQLTKEK